MLRNSERQRVIGDEGKRLAEPTRGMPGMARAGSPLPNKSN